MPTLTLSRNKIEALVAQCERAGRKEYFLAKDRGAYVGAPSHIKGEQGLVYYFAGCNPDKDPDWYHTCLDRFGGDDFGVDMPIEHLVRGLERGAVSATYKVTQSKVSVSLKVKAPA